VRLTETSTQRFGTAVIVSINYVRAARPPVCSDGGPIVRIHFPPAESQAKSMRERVARLDPVIQLAGPKGEAEAADFVMVMGPLVRVLPSLSAAQRENVRATLEVYFRGHATSQGVVLPAEIWVVRARV
jgi:hypothetical protein